MEEEEEEGAVAARVVRLPPPRMGAPAPPAPPLSPQVWSNESLAFHRMLVGRGLQWGMVGFETDFTGEEGSVEDGGEESGATKPLPAPLPPQTSSSWPSPRRRRSRASTRRG